jgi:hypothetical protein
MNRSTIVWTSVPSNMPIQMPYTTGRQPNGSEEHKLAKMHRHNGDTKLQYNLYLDMISHHIA